MLAVNISEVGGLVRLDLGGLARGEGSSLQEAADALIRRAVELALAFRTSGWTVSLEVCPDIETLSLLCELGEIAAAGGDVRARLFQ
jgi:hypothetical protein